MEAIRKLKKELKDRVKACSYVDEVQISGDGKSLIFKKSSKSYKRNGYGTKHEHYYYGTTATEKLSSLFISEQERKKKTIVYTLAEKASAHSVWYYRAYAEIVGAKNVFIRDLSLYDKQKEFGLHHKDEYKELEWSKYAKEFDYALELGSQSVKETYDILERYWLAIKEIKTEHPAFEITTVMDDIRTSLSYYYKGAQGSIGLELLPDGALHIHTVDGIEKTTWSELKATIFAIIEKAYKAKRLQNIYNPPRKVFDEYMEVSFRYNMNPKDDVFETLSKYHSAVDIDEMISIQKINDSFIKVIRNEIHGVRICYFRVIDVYMVTSGQRVIASDKNKETAQRFFCEEVTRQTKIAFENY